MCNLLRKHERYLTDHLAIKVTTGYKPNDKLIQNSDMSHEQ